jgi:fatty-acyl-CoA synthase
MPKGVLWRQEDIFLGAMTSLVDPAGPADALDAIVPDRAPWLVTSPLMHGNGQWNSLRPLLAGNGVSLWTQRHFDPEGVIRQAAADRAQLVVLIGDGMARPFAETLRALVSEGEAPDLSSVAAIASGGAILSPVVKQELVELLPDTLIVDGFGASETGGNGALVGTGDGGAPRFQMKPDTAVLDDDNRPMEPGTGITGRLARTGHIPLGYHKDPVKTAATFPTDDQGRRWAVPGDAARLEADGTITVFGRGSNCINTGGEKVFPEEVEAKIKAHPEVLDAFVLGRPDERFGQRVAAVIARRPGSEPALDDVRAFLREHLAGYKLPREAVFVDAMSYTGPGKPDYRWARAQFDEETAS